MEHQDKSYNEQGKALDTIWEAILMMNDCSPEGERAIIEHEDETFAKYSGIIKGYSTIFTKHGCVLNVGRVWIPFQREPFEGIGSGSRLPHKDGYTCNVYCNVERNGKIVRYNNRDGEVDYYELAMSWNVTSISHPIWSKVSLLEDTEDVIETMNQFVEIISSSDIEFIL